MKMRNLNLSQNHNQNKPEEELHSKDQGVKHLKEEGQETETQRTSTSCLNMQIQVEIGMIKNKRTQNKAKENEWYPGQQRLLYQPTHINTTNQVSSMYIIHV